MTTDLATRRLATIVPEDRREKFLRVLFGFQFLIVAENTVYTFMERLCPRDYGGGFWAFYEYRGKPLFLAPDSDRRFRIEGTITEYRGEVSAEAAGIIATLFTLSHLSLKYESRHLADGYHRLLAYAKGHPEASAILAVID